MSALRPIQPIDITGLHPRAPSSGAPVVEFVDPRELWVDPSYQRNLSERSIRMLRRIIETFDWTKLKPPICAFAEDEAGNRTLRVLDGQHTAIAAASNPHVDRIPVMVVEASDTRSQAAAFIGQNSDRLGITAMQMHAAAVTAGDGEALEMERVCQAAGVTILRNPPSRGVYKFGETVAVSAVSSLIKREGPDHTIAVLRILREARVAPVKSDHIKAVDHLLSEAEFGSIDIEALAVSIMAHPAAMKEAGAFAATHSLPVWKALASVWFKRAKKRRGGAGAGSAPGQPGGAASRGRGEPVPQDLERDPRPAIGGWQPGNHVIRCGKCDQRFRGAPSARECADCAYGEESGS